MRKGSDRLGLSNVVRVIPSLEIDVRVPVQVEAKGGDAAGEKR